MVILIVDDSSLARKMILSHAKKIFPEAKYFPAKNGQEACEKYVELTKRCNKPDIVFLDQLMPVMDGLEALKKILGIDPKTFIIMLTANIQTPIHDEAIKAGAKLFLNKPVSENDFVRIKNLWDSLPNSKDLTDS